MRNLVLALLLACSLTGSALAFSVDSMSNPQSILVGRGGDIWRTTFVMVNHLVDEVPSGCARVYNLGRTASFYSNIATNGAGSVAVVDALHRRMYVEHGGMVQHFDIPAQASIPYLLAGAADDSFWVGSPSTLLKIRNGHVLQARQFSGRGVTSLAMSPDYQTLAFGSGHKVGRLSADGKLIWSAPMEDAVGSPMVVANSGAVWAVSQSRKVLLYDDSTTGIQRAFPLPHTDWWLPITLLPDGTLLAAGMGWMEAYRPDGRVWEVPIPKSIYITSLAYDPTQQRPKFVTVDDKLGFIDLTERMPIISESTWASRPGPCPSSDPASPS